MLPPSYSCRWCTCHALCRLRRRGIDRLFSIIGLRPVRCLTCGRKSYMRLNEKDLTPPEKSNTPISAPLARVAPAELSAVEIQTTSRHAA
jgi:hypothetical protein